MTNIEIDEPRIPQKGDKLFQADNNSNWWHNACLNFFHNNWDLYAIGYKDAADILVQAVLKAPGQQDILVYPIVFLYRQYIELRLKEIIKKGSVLLVTFNEIPFDHNIDVLYKKCKEMLEEVCPKGSLIGLDVVNDFINQFIAIDPGSFAFRYPTDKKGKSSLTIKNINLNNLAEVMRGMANTLDGASAGISELLSFKKDIV